MVVFHQVPGQVVRWVRWLTEQLVLGEGGLAGFGGLRLAAADIALAADWFVRQRTYECEE